MPFKSKAQQGFLYAQHPKIAKRWAKETPNMKDLPKKVKKESVQGTNPLDTVQFWVVIQPHSHESTVQDIITQCDPFQFSEMSKRGLAPDQIVGFYLDEAEASKKATLLLDGMYDTAASLEEKKGEVSNKLQKAIDKLQKKAENHMKMVKKDPENADMHHEEAEKAMARIKTLRKTHKDVESSKKTIKPRIED